jgi:serine/threonine-protein kinase HipA
MGPGVRSFRRVAFPSARHAGRPRLRGGRPVLQGEELDALLRRPRLVEPLTVGQIADRLRALRADATSWLGADFTGQFSLAGAQANTALCHDDVDGWGQPHGFAPTTHILKPAVVGLDGDDLNEHLCLSAARHCGLAAARSRIERFDDQTAIVVDRYDRRQVGGELVRLHQEDLCQALGVHPSRKYQSDGGPSPGDIAELLRSVLPGDRVIESIGRFVDALVFNWIIDGTDAHAKNYSLLHVGRQTRLAPLYDIASSLPYDRSGGHKSKLAMKVGSEYRLLATDRRSNWQRLAGEVGLTHDDVVARVRRLARAAPDAFSAATADSTVVALGSDLPERLVDAVAARAEGCLRVVE